MPKLLGGTATRIATHTPPTPIIDTHRAPFGAVRYKLSKQIGKLGVPTVLPHEPLVRAAAWIAHNGKDRGGDIGQGDCAIAGHAGEST